MPENAIKVSTVSKSFKLPHERHGSLKSVFVNIFKWRKSYEKQVVLKDISLEIKKGEFFGVVGRNGSGKSTLLKLLAGVYSPDKGAIHVNGKLTPFIELGVGFNPELTGRENVFLNGALLGFSRPEMAALYDEIVSFAELDRFMDQKLKNYSSGMQVRLAFSIAIRAQSEILLLDEVLAVGDAAFQQKCYAYFNELKRQKQTVILVTHDMSAVRKFCTQAALVDKGRLSMVGTPEEVARAYEKLNLKEAETRLDKENEESTKSYKSREGDGTAIIDKVTTFDPSSGKSKTTFFADDTIGVRIEYVANANIIEPAVGFIFQDATDVTVFATNNIIKNTKTPDVKAGERLILETIVDNNFTDGEYSITCAIQSTDLTNIYDRIEYIHKFLIGGHQLAHATTHPSHKLTVKRQKD